MTDNGKHPDIGSSSLLSHITSQLLYYLLYRTKLENTCLLLDLTYYYVDPVRYNYK